MFTGLVEAVGVVTAVLELDGGRRLTISAPELTSLAAGDSVAVDGVCLTAVDVEGPAFHVEAVGTTLSRTTIGRYRTGARVNLERALRLGDRLGGHLVQGHVDGVGSLLDVRADGIHHLLDFRVPPEVEAVTVLHGSIAISGVSLTVNALDPGVCQVAIIPHTWANTNLCGLRPGDPVNVEGDVIGKYVARLAAPWLPTPSGLDPTEGGRRL
jgi:riboflavin synthase